MADSKPKNQNRRPSANAKNKPDSGRAAPRFTVLQVLPALISGGVERGTVDVAAAIVKAGGRAIVVSNGGPMERELTRAGAEHVYLPVHSKNPLIMWKNVGRLARIIDQEGVDIVHARSRAPAWSACYAAKRTGVPFLTTFHGTYGTGFAPKRAYNAIMTKGDLVICISGFIAKHVREVYGVPQNRLRVIPRGVDITRFDPDQVPSARMIQLADRWGVPPDKHVILLPGRLTRWKGHEVLIEAVAKVKHDDIYCILVGDERGRMAYRDELKALIKTLGIESRVDIHSHCDDMAAAYKLSDVVISASQRPEAFGRVMAEALAMGRPVIAADHGGAREILNEGKDGLLVPPDDPDALARAIEDILAMSQDKRLKLAKRGIAAVRRRYSRDAMCKSTLDVYEELLGKGRGNR